MILRQAGRDVTVQFKLSGHDKLLSNLQTKCGNKVRKLYGKIKRVQFSCRRKRNDSSKRIVDVTRCPTKDSKDCRGFSVTELGMFICGF